MLGEDHQCQPGVGGRPAALAVVGRLYPPEAVIQLSMMGGKLLADFAPNANEEATWMGGFAFLPSYQHGAYKSARRVVLTCDRRIRYFTKGHPRMNLVIKVVTLLPVDNTAAGIVLAFSPS